MDGAEGDSGVAAVLLAGGASSRFDHDLGKVYVPLRGRPLLAFSLTTLDRSPVVDHVVLVIREGDRDAAMRCVEAVAPTTLRAVVTGGDTRHESEVAGLAAVAGLAGVGWVMLHDAARPFLTLDLLDRLVATGVGRGVGVVPGRPVDDAVVDDEGAVVDTSTLITVQTPQLFAIDDALAAHSAAEADDFRGVDTAETVAAYRDTPIEYVDGDARNLKITTVEDLVSAERWVGDWDAGRWVGRAHDADDNDESGTRDGDDAAGNAAAVDD